MLSRIIIPAFLLSWLISCSGNTGEKPASYNVFADISYDKVVAYSYNGEGGIEIIDEDKKLADEIGKKAQLDQARIIKLTNFLCTPSTYGGDEAACFDPHLGIVFYKANHPTAWVSICLDCNTLVSSVKIPNEKGGFSMKGIKGVMDFEKGLGFDVDH